VSLCTPQQLLRGQKLFGQSWDFKTAASSAASLPPMVGMEVAFLGRSNVGKSSLINGLTNQNALARTSNTPGRTQELIFFHATPKDAPPTPLVLCDMPGYGFAKAPLDKVKQWSGLIEDYLKGRSNLARLFILIDGRHGLKPIDLEVIKGLDKAALSYAIILTKMDQVKEAQIPQLLEQTQEALKKRPAAFPHIFQTSSHTRGGMEELRGAIALLMEQRGF
jgi:GTP-binding protein